MILVTGATGHIGNVLVRELLKYGKPVRAFVLPGDDCRSLKGLDVEIVYGDVRDYNDVLKHSKGIEYFLHLAGYIGISMGKRNLTMDINVGGTRNVVEACLVNDVKRLVYVSSIHALTEPPHGELILENFDFDPKKVHGHYAKSKAVATRYVVDAAKRGLDAVIVHPTGVMGPYEYDISNLGQMIVDYLNRKLFASIKGAYDFVDVRDVARGIVLAMEKGESGQNYILSGKKVTVQEILKTLEKVTGIPAPKTVLPAWLVKATAPFSELYYYIKKQKPLFTSYSIQTLCSNCNTTHRKAALALGYTAMPFEQTIRDAVIWMKKNVMPYKRK